MGINNNESTFIPAKNPGSRAVQHEDGTWHCSGCGGEILKSLGDGKNWGCKGGLTWEMDEWEQRCEEEIDHLGNIVRTMHNINDHPTS